MSVQRIAAFCDGETGGNPAGVVICDVLPAPFEMQAIAARVGYSETAFAAPEKGGWRVRYFAPEIEVPFCGHATIALGAALALRDGGGIFPLYIKHGVIAVEGRLEGSNITAALQSPPTHSRIATDEEISGALALFSRAIGDLDPHYPVSVAHAGGNHLVLTLASREHLAAMQYDLERGRAFMKAHDLTTISVIHAETPHSYHARNPFAVGGVYEDPATGAAAAAFAGYLRDQDLVREGRITIIQGEDMGMRSILHADILPERGSSIRVSGMARIIKEE